MKSLCSSSLPHPSFCWQARHQYQSLQETFKKLTPAPWIDKGHSINQSPRLGPVWAIACRTSHHALQS
jgi:hypothetical protein